MPHAVRAILSVVVLVLVVFGTGAILSRIMPEGRVIEFSWRELIVIILVSIAIVWSRRWRRRPRG